MIVAGIGCRKGVDMGSVIAAVETALEEHGLALTALSALATTAWKREERAIFEAGRSLGLPVMVVEGAVSHPVMPPHPASAPLGHPLPVGERNASAVSANLAGTAGDVAAFRTPTCPQNEQVTVAAKRPGREAVLHTLTRSELSQAVAGTPSVSEAAALAAAGDGARLFGPRTIVGPVTCALAISGDAA